MKSVVISFEPSSKGRQQINARLADLGDVVYLVDLDDDARAQAISEATLMLARNTGKELNKAEHALSKDLQLIQFMSAGLDFIPLHQLPKQVPVAANAGAFAIPMAEHALAMILASAKRLLPEHRNLMEGEFNQFVANRMLQDMTVGILGFGGIGVATARLLKALGVRVHAINRRGHSDEAIDWIGKTDDLDELLAVSDALVLSLPLTARTENLIGARELALMKADATIVNLARGEIINEKSLYDHLSKTPTFTACLDAWWIEPVRHGEFRVDQPFFDLSNVLGSPHNSAAGGGNSGKAMDAALENCRRVLRAEAPDNLAGQDERSYQSRQG